MATTAPTPTWSMGNVAQYTKEGAVTDDTEQWSLGNVQSFLEYEEKALIQIFMYHYMNH